MIVTQPSFFSSLYGGMESNTVEKISWLYVIPIPLSPCCDICSLSRAPGTHRGGFISQGTRGDPGKGCTPRCQQPPSCCCAHRCPTSDPPQAQANLAGRGSASLILEGRKKQHHQKLTYSEEQCLEPQDLWLTPHRKGGQCSSSFPQPDRRHGLMKTNQVLLRL